MSRKPETLEQQWEGFYMRALRTSGVERGSDQYVESKRCFIAGTFSILTEIMLVSNMPNQQAADVLRAWDNEAEAFFAQINAGLA